MDLGAGLCVGTCAGAGAGGDVGDVGDVDESSDTILIGIIRSTDTPLGNYNIN